MVEEFGTFDFGLDEAREERAARLHQDSIIVDALFQGPVGYRVFDDEMNKELRHALAVREGDKMGTFTDGLMLPIRRAFEGRLDDVKDNWDASGITCGNRQVELAEDHDAWKRTFAFVQKQFDCFPWLTKALVADDIRRAHETSTHAGLISTQVMLGPWRDIDMLHWAHDAGLRMCQLTYNNLTKVGAGCTERTDAGLSTFGVASVEAMNELGIIVDTGHVGRMTTLDACEVSEKPVVASHTAAQGVYAHARGKSDEELRAIAATGGFIGVVAVPFFLGPGSSVTIEAMLDHIEYVAEVVGVDHVGIGTDWPLQLPEWILVDLVQPIFAETGFRPEDGLVAHQGLIGFDDYRDFPNITRGLVGRGWSDEDITKVLGANFVRVMEAVCG